MNKHNIIKDFFKENYGSFQMETAYEPYSTLDEDLEFIKKLDSLYIKHKIIGPSLHGWEEIKYYGAYCCLKQLIETYLSCGIKDEDDYILDTSFIKKDWL